MSTAAPDRIQLDSLDAVELSLDVAGVGARSYAFLVDWHARLIIALGWFIAAGFVTVRITESSFLDSLRQSLEQFDSAFSLISIVPAILIYVLYQPLFEILGQGRTPGKRMAGLRIVTTRGHTPGIGALLIRNVFRLVDSLPAAYAVGLVSCMLTRSQVRIGDLAAGTVLVYDKPRTGAETIAELDLQTGVSVAQRDLARELVERWPELNRDVRMRLARGLLTKLDQDNVHGVDLDTFDDAALRRRLMGWIEPGTKRS